MSRSFGEGNESDVFARFYLQPDVYRNCRSRYHLVERDPLLTCLSESLSLFRETQPTHPSNLNSKSDGMKGLRRNRIMIPTANDGYAKAFDDTYLNAQKDLFEGLQKHFGVFEPKILTNHALQTEWANNVFIDQRLQCTNEQLKITDAYCAVYHEWILYNQKLANIDDCRIYMHSDTTPGPNRRLGDGSFYTARDVMYDAVSTNQVESANRYLSQSVDEKLPPDVHFKFRKDYKPVKESWLGLIDDIAYRQQGMNIERYNSLNSAEIIDHFQQGILCVSKPGFRFNSTDKVVNIEPGQEVKKNFTYHTKSRSGNIMTQRGMLYFDINQEKYAPAVYDELGYSGYQYAINRTRVINNVEWCSQLPAQVLTTMQYGPWEDSKYGFASTRVEVVNRYSRFISACEPRDGYEFIFINADRINAETFLTTHQDIYSRLIPKQFRDFIMNSKTITHHGPVCYTSRGTISGIARTTADNIDGGTSEADCIKAKIFGISNVESLQEYVRHMKEDDDYMTFGEYKVFQCLCTDDIPLVIYGPTKPESFWNQVKEDSETRRMEFEWSKQGMVTFGMRFDDKEMKANDASIWAKSMFIEFPGFFSKDCFTMEQRALLLPQEQRDFLNEILSKHFRTSISEYGRLGKGFLQFLQELGIPLDRQFDPYSIVGQLVLGKLLKGKELFADSRIPSKFFSGLFEQFKRLI